MATSAGVSPNTTRPVIIDVAGTGCATPMGIGVTTITMVTNGARTGITTDGVDSLEMLSIGAPVSFHGQGCVKTRCEAIVFQGRREAPSGRPGE